MSDIKKLSSARQFRRHTTRSRRLSRHLREDDQDRSPKRWSPMLVRPRAASDPDTKLTANHPPLRLAQLARQHSLAVHVENWRDDMIVEHQYLPMQQILGSLKSDTGTPLIVGSKTRMSRGTTRLEPSRHHVPALGALRESDAVDRIPVVSDVLAPDVQWQDWSLVYDQRRDTSSPSIDQHVHDWYAPSQVSHLDDSVEPISLFQDLVCSIEADTAALSEEFDRYVNYQESAEQYRAKL